MGTITLVGPGKVGTALAYLLEESGKHEIVSVLYRSELSRRRAKKYLRAKFSKRPDANISNSDIVILALRDTDVRNVCELLKDHFRPKQLVFHVSGSLTDDELETAALAGARIGVLHPIQACPSIADAIRNIPGSYMGVTASSPSTINALKRLARDIGCVPVEVTNDQKLLYHSACVMASNYLVSLAAAAERAMTSTNVGPRSLDALIPLMRGTLDNVSAHGTAAALTGPIARGDVETVAEHLKVLSRDKKALGVYQALGLEALELAASTGGPGHGNKIAIKKLKKLLQPTSDLKGKK